MYLLTVNEDSISEIIILTSLPLHGATSFAPAFGRPEWTITNKIFFFFCLSCSGLTISVAVFLHFPFLLGYIPLLV